MPNKSNWSSKPYIRNVPVLFQAHYSYSCAHNKIAKHTDRSMGRRTTFSLLPTERTSRMIVSLIGSSNVETGAKKSLSCWLATDAPIVELMLFGIVCCCCCCMGTLLGLAHWGPPSPTFIWGCCSCCAIVVAFFGFVFWVFSNLSSLQSLLSAFNFVELFTRWKKWEVWYKRSLEENNHLAFPLLSRLKRPWLLTTVMTLSTTILYFLSRKTASLELAHSYDT